MTPTGVDVSPEHSALDSLERVAEELERDDGALALKGALQWGWHALGLLAYLRLQPARSSFDAWVQDYLQAGEPELEVERDGNWEERQRLSFLELLDLLSAADLTILKPQFYQGWQDRRSRCLDLRRRVAFAVGGAIGSAQRDDLLLLLAAYHRLVRLPAGVRLDPAAIRRAFPALLDLALALAGESGPISRAVAECVGRARHALSA